MSSSIAPISPPKISPPMMSPLMFCDAPWPTTVGGDEAKPESKSASGLPEGGGEAVAGAEPKPDRRSASSLRRGGRVGGG